MNRTILFITLALAAFAVTASADPTKEQLDQAKAAFAEGKTLHDQGKLPEAVEKFKESYRLSQNPLLLYNIGFTLDEAGQKDNALLYYRKFLSDAPPAAAQRKTVQDRVNQLEKEKLDADLNGTAAKPDTTKPDTKPGAHTEPVKIKPAGTYTEKDFQHQTVDVAPPGKPLDITAFVPEDSGWTVTLYYRGNGDSTFTPKEMKWRYKELVARIPAAKVGGTSIQYYIDVKDQTGTKVAGSGKSVSPNLVAIDAQAAPRFYPDWTDEGGEKTITEIKHHDEEDPLHPGGGSHQEDDTELDQKPVVAAPIAPSRTWIDVGSSKFEKAKWISTASAGALVGGSIVFYILAKKQGDNIVADSTMCGTPPCRQFDHDYDKAWQDAGKRYNTLTNITAVVGVGAAAVAGYLWYRELTANKHGELNAASKNKTSSPETSWIVVPSIGDSIGAAAAARF